MRILAAQEDRGKRSGINGSGNGLGLREQGTHPRSPSLAVTALGASEIRELLHVLQCLHSPAPRGQPVSACLMILIWWTNQ